MTNVVKTPVIKIGNSRGIRIPKYLIEQMGLGAEVILTIEEDHLVIRPSAQTREGWAEQFKAMAEAGDDRLLAEGVTNSWDEEEWEW